MQNDTLGVFQGEARKDKISIPAIPLLNADGMQILEILFPTVSIVVNLSISKILTDIKIQI